jgi:hypothetical protein
MFCRRIDSDLYFSNVALLLHMDGTNGSTTFTDSSGTPKTPTVNGGAQISTAQSKFGGASGLFSGGSSDNLNYGSLSIGNQDFFVEAWVYRTGSGVIASNGMDVFATYRWQLIANDNSSITFNSHYRASLGGGQEQALNISVDSLPTSQWRHIAVSRQSNTFRVFVNGSLEGAGDNEAAYTSGAFVVGGGAVGYIDDLRLTVGSSRGYTATFTPPAAAFPDS